MKPMSYPNRRRMTQTQIHNLNRAKPTVPAPFFGPWPLPTIERARQLVGGSCAYYPNEPESAAWAERVAQWIAATGDCVWHAVAEVAWAEGHVTKCFCANCDGRAAAADAASAAARRTA